MCRITLRDSDFYTTFAIGNDNRICNNMKKNLILAVCAVMLAGCQESLEERTAQQAKKFTAERCPMQIGMQVLDSMVFDVPTRTLKRYFRLTGDADHDGLDFDLLKSSLIDELKNEPTYRVYREHGYSFSYEYRSEKNPDVVLFEALLTKDDYGN